MARGIVLIIAAVALGLILLNATDGPDPFQTTSGTGSPSTDDGDGDDDEAVDDGEDGESTETTTTTAPLRQPAEVTVLVANASGIARAASGLSDTIAGFGYQMAEPANAPATVPSSVIHYLPGFEREAQALAQQLNPAPPVQPMPNPQPVPDLRSAQVLVLQGPDLAPSS